MLQRHRVIVALAIVASLSLVVATFGTTPTHQPAKAGAAAFQGQSDVEMNVSEAQQLAARYHLRKRSGRFFRRAVAADLTPSEELQLAARYHLRTRTTRFFDRAVAADLSPSEELQLAARYHLRKRSGRFFRRGVC